MEWINSIKLFVIGCVTSLVAYLNPISGDMVSLLYVFALNFTFGLLAAIVTEHEPFKIKKAWRCIREATVFFVLVCSIYFIGEKKGDEQGALQCVSFITYAMIYFYAVNILRNATKLFTPKSIGHKVLSFLYYLVSVEFVTKIPFLQNYLNKLNEK